jgi:hypothetical protein
VLSEVFEVFGVAGGQREVIGQAARGYPGVVRRPGPASEVGVRGDGAPCAGHALVAVQDVLADQPVGELFASGSSSLALFHPPREFGEGDESDEGYPASELAQCVRGRLAFRLSDAMSVSSTTGSTLTRCRRAVRRR